MVGYRRFVIVVTVVLGVAVLLAFAASARAAAAPGERLWIKYYSSGSLADIVDQLSRGPNGGIYGAGLAKGTEESARLLAVRYSSDGDRLWSRVYAGPGSRGLVGNAAASNGGALYVACTVGTWVFPGRQDIAVVKYAANGERLWTRVFDGADHRQDRAVDIALDPKGRLLVAGVSTRSGTGADIVLLKLSGDGELLWKRYYAGPHKADEAHALALDAGGNAYVAGQSNDAADTPAAVVLKVTPSGHRAWVHRLHGSAGTAAAYDVAVMNGVGLSGVYVTGWASGGMSTGTGMLCAKLGTSNGSVKWQTTAEEPGGDESGYSLGLDATGAVIVAGDTVSTAGGDSRGLVAKWDAAGAPAWRHPYQVGLPTDDAAFFAVAVDAAGNSYCGGYTSGTGHGEDYTVAAFAPNGGTLWGNVFTSSGADADFCNALLIRSDAVYGAGSVTPGDDVPLPGAMNLNAVIIKHQR